MNALRTLFTDPGAVLDSAFISPTYLYFLALLPVVILLYLLKLRRTHVMISSTLLWLKSLQDLTANAPFQRLRKNLLLLLQLLILACLIAGLARPFTRAEGAAGQSICLLVDRSASMQTIERNGTRLDLAKEHALKLVDDMHKGDKMMIVTFAENTDVLCELTDDRVRLRQIIKGIEPTDTRTRLRDAALVAHSLKLTVKDLYVVVVSDGDVSDLHDLGTRDYSLSFLQVGESRNNAGIVAFSVREPLDGQGDRQSFVLVHNANDEPLATTLTLSFDDEVLAVEEVQAGPGEDAELAFEHAALGEGILRATIDHEDDLAVDNTAWLAIRPASSLKVLLVAEPGAASAYFIQKALIHDSRVELAMIEPADYVDTGEYDVTIFNGAVPGSDEETELPSGSLLYLNAVPSLEGLRQSGEIDLPPIIAVDVEHPMMRFLNPSNVGIRKAMKLELPEGARSLVSTVGAPLIADVSRAGQQILVVAFDVAESDWPLRLSFPLFFQNLLSWAPKGALASQSYVVAGRPLTIMPSPDLESVTVEHPRRDNDTPLVETVRLDPLRPVFYPHTEGLGVYTIARGDEEETHAVNLLDKTESGIRPAESLVMGRSEIEAERGQVKQNRELWRWFVVGGLLVLILEWWVYSRRAWV